WIRHRQGGRLASQAVPPGGNRKVGVRELFEEHSGEELGEESGSSQFRILGRQMIEMEKALESLEDQFNLPAEAVNLQNFFRRQLVAAGGCEQQDVPCEFQRLGLDLCAIPAGFAEKLFACLLCGGLTLAQRDESNRHGRGFLRSR